MITVKQAAEQLGVKERMVRLLLEQGRLKGQKWAGTWIVDRRSLNTYVPRRVGGRIKGQRIKADSLRRARDRVKAKAKRIQDLTPEEIGQLFKHDTTRTLDPSLPLREQLR